MSPCDQMVVMIGPRFNAALGVGDGGPPDSIVRCPSRQWRSPKFTDLAIVGAINSDLRPAPSHPPVRIPQTGDIIPIDLGGS